MNLLYIVNNFCSLRVQRKEYKKRPLATIPLTLADGIELGVSVYVFQRIVKFVIASLYMTW